MSTCEGCKWHGHDDNAIWDRDDTCAYPDARMKDYGGPIPVLGTGCKRWKA